MHGKTAWYGGSELRVIHLEQQDGAVRRTVPTESAHQKALFGRNQLKVLCESRERAVDLLTDRADFDWWRRRVPGGEDPSQAPTAASTHSTTTSRVCFIRLGRDAGRRGIVCREAASYSLHLWGGHARIKQGSRRIDRVDLGSDCPEDC